MTVGLEIQNTDGVRINGLDCGNQGNTPITSQPAGHISGMELTWIDVTTLDLSPGRCRDAGNNTDIILPSIAPADVSVSGAGGLDIASEQANKWLYCYCIADTEDVNPTDTLLSLIEPGVVPPTLPGGFFVHRFVGSIRNDGSSNYRKFHQYRYGNLAQVWYEIDLTNSRVLNNGNATSFTEIDLEAFMPKTARGLVHLSVRLQTPSEADGLVEFRPTGSTIDPSPHRLELRDVENGTAIHSISISVPTAGDQKIEYRVNSSSRPVDIHVLGYDELI